MRWKTYKFGDGRCRPQLFLQRLVGDAQALLHESAVLFWGLVLGEIIHVQFRFLSLSFEARNTYINLKPRDRAHDQRRACTDFFVQMNRGWVSSLLYIH